MVSLASHPVGCGAASCPALCIPCPLVLPQKQVQGGEMLPWKGAGISLGVMEGLLLTLGQLLMSSGHSRVPQGLCHRPG